jgi:cell division protein FtsB
MSIDLIFENAQLKGRVIALDAEVKCLEAVIRAHERVDCLSVTSLKKQLVEAEAENARLKAEVERLTYVDDFIVITKPSIKQLIEQGAQNTPGRYDEQYLIQVDRECYLKVLKHMAEFWEKAKEGKQS